MKNSISLLLAMIAVSAVCQPSWAGAKGQSTTDAGGCVDVVHAWNITAKHDMALFMGVPKERMPALFCQRLAEGIRSGRISYSDINNLQLDLPTDIWMVLKGKPKPAKVMRAPAPRSLKFRNCSGVDGSFQVPVSQNCPLSGWANH